MKINRSSGTPRQPARGFTLIELLIVISIIGILSSIAYPAYTSYVNKAGRSDAKTLLLDTAQELERCMSMYGAYDDANCGAGAGTSNEGFYEITAGNAAIGATTFTITATPVAGERQVGDQGCTSFSLTQAGARSATGTATNCW